MDFSEDALFTSDGVAARVTVRVDLGRRGPGRLRRHRHAGRAGGEGQEVRSVIVGTVWDHVEVVGAVDPAAPPTQAELDAISKRAREDSNL